MTTIVTRRLLAIALTAVVVGACATARATLPPGAIAVPTDDNLVPSAGTGILCNPSALVPPLGGELAGDASDPAWPVWLLADDGRRIYVVWPRGFSVRFDPDATLLDETGAPVVLARSPVRLQQTRPGDDGSRDHPYLASGLWETGLAHEGHCYVQKS